MTASIPVVSHSQRQCAVSLVVRWFGTAGTTAPTWTKTADDILAKGPETSNTGHLLGLCVDGPPACTLDHGLIGAPIMQSCR
jgi:hypothetical protein